MTRMSTSSRFPRRLPLLLSLLPRGPSFGNNALDTRALFLMLAPGIINRALLDTFLINSAYAAPPSALASPGPFLSSARRHAPPRTPNSPDPTHSRSHSSTIRTRTRTRTRASRIGAGGSRVPSFPPWACTAYTSRSFLPPTSTRAPVGLIPSSLRLCLRLFPALPLSSLGAFCAVTDQAVVEGGRGASVFVQSRLRLSLSLSLPISRHPRPISSLLTPTTHGLSAQAHSHPKGTRVHTHMARSASYCYFEPSPDPDYARGRACRAAHLGALRALVVIARAGIVAARLGAHTGTTWTHPLSTYGQPFSSTPAPPVSRY
ncbi:hypothetical protein B0H13DRAFT_2362566 [Mycena leptocephala]|nr:hypothetical protein B0H13DRAFT_2362566 [Mycena leptocephala]